MAKSSQRRRSPTLAPQGAVANEPYIQEKFASIDFLWVLVLALTTVAIGWPILQGGYRTYLDNPVHVAEIAALAATPTGWSEIGFAGMPLDTLHSPLVYGSMVFLCRIGLDFKQVVEPVYCFFLLLGFMAPAIAIFVIARRRTALFQAALLSYSVLVMRPAIVGTESAFGGMWTAPLALSGVLLVVDQLVRNARKASSVLLTATIVGFVGLTHLFAVVVLVVVFFVHAGLVFMLRRTSWKNLIFDSCAFSAGALASSWYWMPFFMEQTASRIVPQNLPVSMLIPMFFLGLDILPMQSPPDVLSYQMFFTDKAPGLLILFLGLCSLAYVRRQPLGIAHYGLFLALLFGVSLVAIADTQATFLGPISWRFLRYIYMGLALAAIVTVDCLRGKINRFKLLRKTRASVIGCGIVLVLLGFWWGWPLRAIVATPAARGDKELAEVDTLWKWLRENRKPEWGRVYMQDTFYNQPQAALLSKSHVLALTALESGVEQVGTYYANMPFETRWTLSEFGTLNRQRITDTESINKLTPAFDATNVGVLVLSSTAYAALFDRHPKYRRVFSIGRFTVFERIQKPGSSWVRSLNANALVNIVRRNPGLIHLEVNSPPGGSSIWTHESWHPLWRLRQLKGPEGAKIKKDRSGIMVVDGIPEGTHELVLEYQSSQWPFRLSMLGWSIIGCAWLVLIARALRNKNKFPQKSIIGAAKEEVENSGTGGS